MNAITLGRIACTSRLGAVSAHEAQQQPSLLVLKGNLQTIAVELKRLVARPTVAFLQYHIQPEDDQDEFEKALSDFVAKRLPSTTQVLGAFTMSLQCAWNPAVPSSKTVLQTGDRSSEVAMLLATFPEAQAQAFHIPPSGRSMPDSEDDSDEEYSSSEEDEQDACEGNTILEVQAGQDASATLTKSGYPATSSTQKRAPQDPLQELLRLDPAPKVVVVYHADRGSSQVIERIQAAFPEAAIIGGVVMGRQVIVGRGKKISQGRGIGAMAISGNAPLFAMTCPFDGCPKGAVQLVASSMRRAQELATQNGDTILGALLFTCNARGHHMFGRDAQDAAIFQAQFPQAPLMGFYAGGEIGPDAEDSSTVTFLRGKACMQGFTAVFGFFLVPCKRLPSAAFQRAVLHGEVQQAFLDIQQ